MPVGQAAAALREKIVAGQAPGLKAQWDLFSDCWGHPQSPLRVLDGYCHFAVIYRRSPVGLPVPADLARDDKLADKEKLNRLLQELAWAAVVQHPLSGVKGAAQPVSPKSVAGVLQPFVDSGVLAVIGGTLCRVDKSAGDLITIEQYDNFTSRLPTSNSGRCPANNGMNDEGRWLGGFATTCARYSDRASGSAFAHAPAWRAVGVCQ